MRANRSLLCKLVLFLSLTLPLAGLLPGCGGCGGRAVPGNDMGLPPRPDLWLPDSAPPDLPPWPPPPDLTPWPDLWPPSPDLAPPDLTPPDAPPPKGPTVVYSVGPSNNALTFKRINLDGTGKQNVPGVPTSISITTLYPGGPLEYAAVSRHRPTPQEHITPNYRGVHLPGGRGALYHFQLNSGGGRGFLQIWPSGKVTLLGQAAGYSTSQQTYGGYVAIQQDGALFAAVRAFAEPSKAAVMLFRTDGKTFVKGQATCNVTPKAPLLYFVESMSMTLTKSHLYFAARPVGGFNPPWALYRAPLDCSAKAAKVKLSAAGFANDTTGYIGPRMVTSEDGGKLALVAGASKKSVDIVVVDDATGAAVKASSATVVDMTSGRYIMRASAGCQLALSPGGKRVAWVADTYWGVQGQTVVVRPTDNSAPPKAVMVKSVFAAKIKHVPTIQWANDEDLLFWAGEALVSLDLFGFNATTGASSNLTATGGATQPFSGGGKLIPRGGWTARNGQWIYFLQYRYNYPKSTCDLRAVSRKTLQLKVLTQGLYVTHDGTNIEAVEGSAAVFFFARPPGAGTSDEVYVFDQDSASAPQQLTTLAKAQTIWQLAPEAGGKRVAILSGSSTLHVAEVGPPTKVSKTLSGPGGRVLFSPDGSQLVFGTGSWSQGLVSLDLASGKSKSLDSGGAVSVFAAGGQP